MLLWLSDGSRSTRLCSSLLSSLAARCEAAPDCWISLSLAQCTMVFVPLAKMTYNCKNSILGYLRWFTNASICWAEGQVTLNTSTIESASTLHNSHTFSPSLFQSGIERLYTSELKHTGTYADERQLSKVKHYGSPPRLHLRSFRMREAG